MEDLLIILLQFLFELVFDIIIYWLFDLMGWQYEKFSKPRPLWLTIPAWCGLGTLAGILSVLAFSKSLITIHILRLFTLAVAPLTSAYIAEAIAKQRVQKDNSIIPRRHFWQAF
jgi:hypothetical protein